MRRISVSLWTPLLAASLAGLLAGCGGSGESDSLAPAGEEAVAIAPPPAPPVSQQASMPGRGDAPEGEQTAAPEAQAEPAETPEAAPSPAATANVSNAAATDEILKLALNENKSLSPSTDAAASTTTADPNTSGGPPASGSGAGSAYSQQMQGQGGSSSGGYGAPPTSNSSGAGSAYAQQMQGQGGSSSGGYGAPASSNSSGAGSAYSQQMQGQGGSSSGGYGAPASSTSNDGSNYAEMMRGQYGNSSGGNSGGAPGANSGYPGSTASTTGTVNALAKEPDFSNPVKGAESFLAAVATRDSEIIAQTIAIRSEFEAIPKHKEIFSNILKRAVSQDMLDKMAEAFKDMKVMNTNTVKSTAMLGVIVGRTEESGHMTTWTLEMRREKAGWKLRDFSGPRIFKQSQMGGQNRRGNAGSTGGGSDYGSSGGDFSGSP